jgi:hypothetical protein
VSEQRHRTIVRTLHRNDRRGRFAFLMQEIDEAAEN